jgi:uncharacterized protein YbaR (Trm112 family)
MTETFNAHVVTPEAKSNPQEQFVDGPKLLELLFTPECRPTLRWLRDQQKARRIPFVKMGRLVFFSPAQVRRALERK